MTGTAVATARMSLIDTDLTMALAQCVEMAQVLTTAAVIQPAALVETMPGTSGMVPTPTTRVHNWVRMMPTAWPIIPLITLPMTD